MSHLGHRRFPVESSSINFCLSSLIKVLMSDFRSLSVLRLLKKCLSQVNYIYKIYIVQLM